MWSSVFMAITKGNLLQHELIGLRMKVLDASDPNLVGKEGVIVDETRNTIDLKENKEIKKVPKKESTIRITIPKGEKVKVKGTELVARPEDRVKKLR